MVEKGDISFLFYCSLYNDLKAFVFLLVGCLKKDLSCVIGVYFLWQTLFVDVETNVLVCNVFYSFYLLFLWKFHQGYHVSTSQIYCL